MVYVPTYNNSNCAVISNNNTIRVYESKPTNNTTIPYIDYYFNSHYLSTTGTQQFSNYVAIPTCLPNSDITTEWWHRTDVSDILICILILSIFICIPFKVLFRLFRRFN